MTVDRPRSTHKWKIGCILWGYGQYLGRIVAHFAPGCYMILDQFSQGCYGEESDWEKAGIEVLDPDDGYNGIN